MTCDQTGSCQSLTLNRPLPTCIPPPITPKQSPPISRLSGQGPVARQWWHALAGEWAGLGCGRLCLPVLLRRWVVRPTQMGEMGTKSLGMCRKPYQIWTPQCGVYIWMACDTKRGGGVTHVLNANRQASQGNCTSTIRSTMRSTGISTRT